MGAVTDLRRLLGSTFVEQIARRLEREGSAKRAPNFTLIQVDASQTGLFEMQISTIAKLFDRVLVVWPEPERPSRLPDNVEVFTAEDGVVSRWQLLKKCSEGFVFPVSLVKPIQPSHVAHLKRHLFAAGGANAVGLHNFATDKALAPGQTESAFDLVPMPLIDPDYAVIDQRFWKLGGSEFEQGDDAVDLAFQAHRRDFALYACNDALAQPRLSKPSDLVFSRFDLVEAALRVPKLVQNLTPASLQLWHKTWDALGVKAEAGSSSELQESLSELLAKNDSVAKTAKAATRKLLGKKTKPQGARS